MKYFRKDGGAARLGQGVDVRAVPVGVVRPRRSAWGVVFRDARTR